MKSLQHVIEYAALAAFAFCARLLPLSWATALMNGFADFIYFCVRVRKDVVMKNLTDSFPEKPKEELEKIARSTYRQFARTMLELLFFPKLKPADIDRMVTVENAQCLERALAKTTGAVLVGAHFGNWELMGAALARRFPITFIVGLQSNQLADGLLNSYRIRKGIKIVSLKLALRGVLEALKRNELVALLSDQDAHEKGTFVNYFGRPASTPKGPAIFALRTGAPLILCTMIREGNGHFRAVLDEVPRPAPSGNEEKDIHDYTQAYTTMLENYARQYPDHWFWFHKRWKTKPNPSN